MCRIGAELLHPLAQHVLMNVRVPPSLRQRNRRCFTNLTAWILNSRVYLRLSMIHLRLHETPNSVSIEWQQLNRDKLQPSAVRKNRTLEIDRSLINVGTKGRSSGKLERSQMEVRVAFLALSVAFAIAVIGATITTTKSVETKQTPTHVILSGPIART